jgi:peptidoglycan hydrolase-like amidase
MKKIWLFLSCFLFITFPVLADEVTDLQGEIDELEKLKNMSRSASNNLEKEVLSLDKKVKNIRYSLDKLQKEVKDLKEETESQEKNLEKQIEVFKIRFVSLYKNYRTQLMNKSLFFDPFDGSLVRSLMYKNKAKQKDEEEINSLKDELEDLAENKKDLERKQTSFQAMEKQFKVQVAQLQPIIDEAKAYQVALQKKIQTLSQQQQAVINSKTGTTTTSVGDVPPADDPAASISYKPQAPSNSFALFSFGGYSHRNGMSQYGAKARAESGQSAEDILKAYYPSATLKKDYSAMGDINVQGYGQMSFEGRYLQGIYEMPGSWHKEALKAQAIAARTFAIRHTNNGSGSICTTEACQVFKNSHKGGDWENAVNETKSWVLVDGSGNPVSTQYASTHGGYSNTGGWDTTDGSGSGNWASKAWETKAKSPWFYKSWYRKGYSRSGDSCGRSHPWLSQEEFCDIVNVWVVRKNPVAVEPDRILPITINSCRIEGVSGNPYSISEIRDLAGKSGGAVTNVNSASVSHSDKGQSATVTLQTNRGELKISASEFKTAFNLRAPGFLRIPQSSFTFFNIEYKK